MQKPRSYLLFGFGLTDYYIFFFHASSEFGHVSCVLLALIFALNSIIKFYGFPRKSTLVKLYCTFGRLLTHSHLDLSIHCVRIE